MNLSRLEKSRDWLSAVRQASYPPSQWMLLALACWADFVSCISLSLAHSLSLVVVVIVVFFVAWNIRILGVYIL